MGSTCKKQKTIDIAIILMIRKPMRLVGVIVLLGLYGVSYPQDFFHHSDVVEKVSNKFYSLETYQAKFTFTKSQKGKKQKKSYGTVYYKQPSLINFTFSKPSEDTIISNGRKMWLYLAKLNAVGIQDLTQNQDSLYSIASRKGILQLFKRYHYRFNTPKQPVTIQGKAYYILHLEEKVNHSSFTTIQVYVDASSFFIRKLVALSSKGYKVELALDRVQENPKISNKYFTYQSNERTIVVENPLTVE